MSTVFGLSSYQVYGTYPLECSLYVITCPRVSAVVSHIPWITHPLLAIASKGSVLVRARQFCTERTLERLRMGANRKDLFYYLVSSLIIVFDTISQNAMTERRGTP
jgi:hypothetical protein